MKKYFIIAAAAVVAMAACSKVEVTDNTPDKKISFEVAKYVGQTKAAEDPSELLLTEFVGTDEGFSSKAWLHANGNAGTDFFGTASTYTELVTRSGSDGDYTWAPQLEYFWPKATTSYINFISWYGSNSNVPTVTETTMQWGTAAAPMTIVTNDNFLFADEAWRYTSASANASTYTSVSDAHGVPTLFHHALAKVAFNVCLKTDQTSTKTIWDVDILTAQLVVGNNGYLDLINKDPNANQTLPWKVKVGDDYDAATNLAATSASIGWVRPTSLTTETIEETSSTNEVTKQFEKPTFENFQPTTLTNGYYTNTDGFKTLLAERTVMPQTINGGVVTFGLTFRIRLYHDANSDGTKDGDAFSDEVVTVPVENLYAKASAIAAWNMNTKYTYNVTIDPVGKKVTFDPAVAEWNSAETEQEIFSAND